MDGEVDAAAHGHLTTRDGASLAVCMLQAEQRRQRWVNDQWSRRRSDAATQRSGSPLAAGLRNAAMCPTVDGKA